MKRMERRIPFKVLYYGMEKEQYHMKGDFDDSFSSLFQCEKNLVHRINRFYFSKLAESEFGKAIEANWGFIIHEAHLVLFRVGTTAWNGKNYAYIKGWVFEAKDIHLVWINLREIIMLMKMKEGLSDGFVSEGDLYDLRRKQYEDAISKEISEFLRKDFVPKSFVYTNLTGEIWTQIPYVFSVAPVIEPKCSTIVRKEDWAAELEEYRHEYHARFNKYGSLNLEYEIPNVKNRPGQESYFKERKKIKKDIKHRLANWRLHTIVHHKHYVRWIEIPMDNVSFGEIEGFFSGMRERIDRGD